MVLCYNTIIRYVSSIWRQYRPTYRYGSISFCFILRQTTYMSSATISDLLTYYNLHYYNVTSASWRLKPSAIQLFVQQFVQGNIEGNDKGLLRWPFVRGIRWIHQRPVTRKKNVCLDVIMPVSNVYQHIPRQDLRMLRWFVMWLGAISCQGYHHFRYMTLLWTFEIQSNILWV